MNNIISNKIIQDIAIYMRVPEAFIEKDFYATQIINKLSTFSCLGHNVIFTGGTSLSKGFDLIKRFSEDLDFNIHNAKNISQSERKTIRCAFSNAIATIPDIQIESKKTYNAGKKETLFISYPKIVESATCLRTNLQVELFFDDNLNTDIIERKIISFIDTFTNKSNTTTIKCNSPFNIMADKYTALIWRIYKNNTNIDYTLMRHLHDICALSKIIPINNNLKLKIIHNFETKDKLRLQSTHSFKDIAFITTKKLNHEKDFQKGYTQFVNAMSYATNNEQILFPQALTIFNKISALFID